MSRSVRDNPIGFPYPPKADFTLAEAEQRIAMSQAAVASGCKKAAAGNCSRPAGTVCLPVGAIDIAKLEQLAPKCMCA
jgi:hypothetical protein